MSEVPPGHLPERVMVTLPADNPLYDDLRAFLAPLRGRGSNSPLPGVLAQLCLLGFQVYSGKLTVPGAGAQASPVEGGALGNVAELQAAIKQIEDANEWGFES